MKITAISASMRANSQSLKVSKWLLKQARDLNIDAELLDLNELSLPLYNDTDENPKNANIILKQLEISDGFVFVSPEWNGMMSHGLLNMLHYVREELAHKPVMLAGVSSGRGGHYPLMEMRLMGYKNSHFVVIPENLLVQDCKNVLNDHVMDENAPDFAVKNRASYGLSVLDSYAEALSRIRSKGLIDFITFTNGV